MELLEESFLPVKALQKFPIIRGGILVLTPAEASVKTFGTLGRMLQELPMELLEFFPVELLEGFPEGTSERTAKLLSQEYVAKLLKEFLTEFLAKILK